MYATQSEKLSTQVASGLFLIALLVWSVVPFLSALGF
jgi:hypothetical protein